MLWGAEKLLCQLLPLGRAVYENLAIVALRRIGLRAVVVIMIGAAGGRVEE
jgi:hypothetical protein